MKGVVTAPQPEVVETGADPGRDGMALAVQASAGRGGPDRPARFVRRTGDGFSCRGFAGAPQSASDQESLGAKDLTCWMNDRTRASSAFPVGVQNEVRNTSVG